MFDKQTKWLSKGQVTDALKAIKDCDASNVILIYAKQQGI